MDEFFIAFVDAPRDTSDPFDNYDEAFARAKELAFEHKASAFVLKTAGGISVTPQYEEITLKQKVVQDEVAQEP